MSDTPPPLGFKPIGIGNESRAPFVCLPEPATLFARRAARFAERAEGGLAPYMRFLASVAGAQAASVAPVPPVPDDEARRAAGHGMPPIDRTRLKQDGALMATVGRFLDACAGSEMPETAAAALAALRAEPERLAARIADALEDAVPMEHVAEFVFAAAGVQVHLACLAAQLPAEALQPVGDGACPCCGGPPVCSIVGGHGARYAVCAACATEWNVVRVKCALCGSTAGIAYQRIEGSSDGIQAETCDSCGMYLKIMGQSEQPGLDPVADDVASLALDMKLAESAWKRGAMNAFLAGY